MRRNEDLLPVMAQEVKTPETLRKVPEGSPLDGIERWWLARCELHSVAWEAEVNTLINERDLARRANEQNIKIIKNLRKQLRKDKQR